ncbi:MAG: non-ribosomal peptide synthetase [Candidatus Rokuibacteriota bacterium]
MSAFIAQKIAERAAIRPDAPAIGALDGLLAYRALDRRSNALAHRLRALGVGPDVVVAVIAPRSATLAVAALAILKAGGAYLPIDPAYPRDRISFLLADGGPAAVLHAPGLAVPPLPPACPAIEVDATAGEAADRPPPATGATSAHLAYLIYTSGSTGQPKGVECTRRGLDNLVRWHLGAFGVSHEDRAMLYASPGFDAAVWEIWPALAAGASLHLPDDETRLWPERLRDWLVAEGITIGFVPTPMAERLIALDWPEDTRLRTLLTGADTLHRYPRPTLPFALVNNYGPTECTVVATSSVVPPMPGSGRPPIGRPIDGVTAWVRDERGFAVEDGQAGELYLGGAGVARGYRRRDELTAERFVPDPSTSGGSLYRTGDLARRLPDGQLAFLGRADDQIKVRGFRVEPAEVIAALDAQPGIAASAVAARADAVGEQRLVAYVVPAADARLRAHELRTTLAAALPDYMVPAVFVQLAALPVSPNGKIDRDALPAPEEAHVLRDDGTARELTAIETRVAAILSSLLDVAIVGVDDNFFLLGGHSLLGTQVITRVREAFGVELPLRTLFDHPTVAALSAQIERAIDAELEAA